ncbi:MAG: hypothetical protein NVSMB18_30380 [Acetobacteraceae bacterium]
MDSGAPYHKVFVFEPTADAIAARAGTPVGQAAVGLGPCDRPRRLDSAERNTQSTIQTDGAEMVNLSETTQEARKGADSEKITINLGFVDLGHIDLMVNEGFYSNRTDFIRTSIRNQLEKHADVARRSVARRSLDLGLRSYSREELEAVRAAGETLRINVLGLASIARDVTPELARATIGSITVLGALHASAEVRAALLDRMR